MGKLLVVAPDQATARRYLLLELARRQRVDLARISITMLVDQYLDAVTSADRTDLTQAANWLVMTAWLTWLKSRLLVPANPEAAQQAEQAQHVLTQRLVELERVRATADWLSGQPQLGWDMPARRPFAWMPSSASIPPAATCSTSCRPCRPGWPTGMQACVAPSQAR